MAFIKFKPLASSFYFYSTVSNDELDDSINKYLGDGEKIVFAFRSQRDVGLFTNKRVVLIDRKGLRGFCRSVFAIDYKAISSYILNIRNLDSSIEIITNSSHRVLINILKPVPLDEVYEVYKYLTNYVTKD
jgi:hypothetical protein